jgi:DNA-binding FrmR family transcriptional regulator
VDSATNSDPAADAAAPDAVEPEATKAFTAKPKEAEGVASGGPLDASQAGATGALASHPDTRDDALRRLRKIEGQVRGLQRMVDEGRYCADVLTQIASVQQALRAVGKVLMRTHLEHCITDALRSGDALEAERAYGEVLDLMYRHVR